MSITQVSTRTFRLDFRKKLEVYLNPATESEPRQLGLRRIAREYWGPRFYAHSGNPQYNALVHVFGGKGWFKNQFGQWELGRGDFFHYGPGVPYELYCDPGDPLDIHIVAFKGDEIVPLVKESLGGCNILVQPRNEEAIFGEFEAMLKTAIEKPPLARTIIEQQTRVLLLQVMSGLRRPIAPNRQASLTFVKCQDYIDTHCLAIKSLAEVADACGVTQNYICALFKAFSQESPYHYLQRRKLGDIAEKLHTGSMSIKELAFEAGYGDLYSFSKAFKRLFGLSPQKYRRQYRTHPVSH